jgi:TetR/AcrR family transcriptional repressor of nem operon
MQGAGLTQGAFYKQFESKEDLAVQASKRALESSSDRWARTIAAHPEDPLGAVLSFYLSREHRDEVTDGCPIVALGADAVRHGGDVKRSFEDGVKGHLERLTAMIAATDPEEADTKALKVLSTMVGAMMLTRLVDDPQLAGALLDTATEEVRRIAAS